MIAKYELASVAIYWYMLLLLKSSHVEVPPHPGRTSTAVYKRDSYRKQIALQHSSRSNGISICNRVTNYFGPGG